MRATRKPTGKPSWPIMLLAGREGAGKSWSAAQASGSPLVDGAYWVSIGEQDPDEYALVPGANFEIVPHDGTFRDIVAAVREVAAEPVGEKPKLLVIDSATRLWDLLKDTAQARANNRAKGKKTATGDFTISMDLWNSAADEFGDVMDAVRSFRGPVILTARLESVAVVENGQPTTQKDWKIQGHKSLPFDSQVIVQMRERGQAIITKAVSARQPLERPQQVNGVTVQQLWDRLGLSDGVGERSHSDIRPTSEEREAVQQRAPQQRQAAQPQQQRPAAAPQADDGWQRDATAITDVEKLTALYNEASEKGVLGHVLSSGLTVDAMLRARKKAIMSAPAAAAPDTTAHLPMPWLAQIEEARSRSDLLDVKAALDRAQEWSDELEAAFAQRAEQIEQGESDAPMALSGGAS